MKEDRLPPLLIKSTEGKTFAEVRNEIRYKIKSEDSRVEASLIRRKKDGADLVKLGPKTTRHVLRRPLGYWERRL